MQEPKQQAFPLLSFTILCLVGLLAMLAWHCRVLYDWDAAQFALALTDFNPLQHRPQPPGYPLLVASARGLSALGLSANAAFLCLNAFALVLASFFLVSLVSRWFGSAVALLTQVFFLTSPAVLFTTNIASAYMADTAAALSIVWASARFLDSPKRCHLFQLAFCFALATGVRQNLGVLFAPLVFFVLWRMLGPEASAAPHGERLQKRDLILAGTIFSVTLLSWLLPLLSLSGGPAAYRRASQELLAYQFHQTSLFYGISGARFGKILLRFLGWTFLTGLGLAALPFALGLRRHGREVPVRIRQFMLWWAAPSSLFFLFFHLPKPGYLLAILGPFWIIAARGLLGSESHNQSLHPSRRVLALGLLLTAGNLALFAFGRPIERPGYAVWNQQFGRFSRGELRQREAIVEDLVAAVRRRASPETTLLITVNDPAAKGIVGRWLRHAMVYLPEFTLWEVSSTTETPSIFTTQFGHETGKSFANHEYTARLSEGVTAQPDSALATTDLPSVLVLETAGSSAEAEFFPEPGVTKHLTPEGNLLTLWDLKSRSDAQIGGLTLRYQAPVTSSPPSSRP